ncbi:MAG: FkbM family methyltransferase [Candidatus Gracilibacteria bacterium]|nr:FkbM family methyltransferase [Candidatus Gracilibacteria bacterium]
MKDLKDKYEKALYYEIFINKEYSIIEEKIKKSKIIFDIGSHIGLFSLYSLEINPNTKIHLFESNENNYNKSKYLLQKYLNNIKFNNYFIDNKNGIIEFYNNKEMTMQSSFYNNQFLCKNGEKQLIKSINIIEYIISNQLNYDNSIDLVKIDIEGYEFELLLNINKDFFKYARNLIFEYHILFPDFNLKYELLFNLLKKYYKNISTQKSKYSEKVGLIYCSN